MTHPAPSNSARENPDWHRLRERLLGFIRSRVSHPSDAEDLLHDVFARMQQNIDQLESDERIEAWLYRITRNVIIDYYRRRQRRSDALEALENAPHSASLTPRFDDDPEVLAQLSRCVARHVTRLPPKYRQALEAVDLGQKTHKQAAQELNLSISGMKSRVQRGREHLKGLLLECCKLELDHRGEVMGIDASCCGTERC